MVTARGERDDTLAVAAGHAAHRVLRLAAGLYACLVVYGSLLPFDFHARPFGEALRALAQGGIFGPSRTDWATNVALFVPMSLLWASAALEERAGGGAWWRALLVLCRCVAVSAAIELAQLWFPSRSSSLGDLTANAIGGLLGLLLWPLIGPGMRQALRTLTEHHLRGPRQFPYRGAVLLPALAGYSVVLAGLAGWFTRRWVSPGEALARLPALHLLPLYYHQEASILIAIPSAVVAAGAYFPVGLLRWVVGTRRESLRMPVDAVSAALWGAGIAACVEASKLLLDGKRPDTGNIVIAMLAAAMGYLVAPGLLRRYARSPAALPADEQPAAKRYGSGLPGPGGAEPAMVTATGLSTARLLDGTSAVPGPTATAVGGAALLFGLLAAWGVGSFPIGRAWIAVGFLVYAVGLWRYPGIWLAVLPAALPVLDLAPWTGRFFFDEFDFLVLTTLAVGYWRMAADPPTLTLGRGAKALGICLAASVGYSVVVGLLPLDPAGPNAFASYYSHYNALRIGKGFIWAGALVPLLVWQEQRHASVPRWLSGGMVAGLAAASLSVVWERVTYVALLDFSRDFRVSGLFSTMHTGGAHLDAFLATALPFAAARARSARTWASRAGAALAAAAGTYALMVTFARSAFAALAVVTLLVAVGGLIAWLHTHERRAGPGVAAIALSAIVMAVAIPILTSSFAQSRLADTSKDIDIRVDHWSDTLRITDPSWSTALLGMGFGRFPSSYRARTVEAALPAVHRYEKEDGNGYLRLGSGTPLYTEQIVAIHAHTSYTLSLKMRSRSVQAALNVLLCERTFFHGFGCGSVTLGPGVAGAAWESHVAAIESGRLGSGAWPFRRTVKLSLENAAPGTTIDVDDVSLVGPTGVNLVANGNFTAGGDRWFLSSAHSHLPWHVKSLWLQIVFDQGWAGLLVFIAAVGSATGRVALLAWRGSFHAAILLASLGGFLTVGTFDSLFDAPRLTMLFFLLLVAAAVCGNAGAHAVRAAARPAAPGSSPGIRSEALRHRFPEAGAEHAGATGAAAPWAVTLWRIAPDRLAWQSGLPLFLHLAGGVALTSAVIWVATRAPFMPYRVRELPNLFHPLLALVILAVFLYWTFAVPAAVAGWLVHAGRRAWIYPLVLALHGALAWTLLHYGVLPGSIHAIVGSPVLNWPWVWEVILRFVPLYSVLSTALTGAALTVLRAKGVRAGGAVLVWLVCVAGLYPLQYWVIITHAATDNLTELVAGGASVGATLLIAAYLVVIGLAGSGVAAFGLAGSPRRWGIALAIAAASVPLGYLALTFGTEAAIHKYGTVFSALQSLLSMDRAHYATGAELWIRVSALHLAAIAGIAFVQYPLWMRGPTSHEGSRVN